MRGRIRVGRVGSGNMVNLDLFEMRVVYEKLTLGRSFLSLRVLGGRGVV